jgi:glycosyltransferase involved in cell wall biosynthesis
LEHRGHSNVLYVQDPFCPGEVRTSRNVISAHFPPMRARVLGAAALQHPSIGSLDALLATSWPTAYTVRSAPTGVPRGYLVQDFEPWFSPAGAQNVPAEATYRFGFRGLTAGGWLGEHLAADYGMRCDHVDFGVDAEVYSLAELGERRAVVFYARPCSPRRGFGLGLLALELLAARRPDVEIHLFGEDLRGLRLGFPCVNHGVLTPQQINGLLNRCAAGLVLSFTNMSLLPFEMLAAGCVPVVNDAPHNRRVLDNPFVRYVEPTAEALAEGLEGAVNESSGARLAERAAASVAGLAWEEAASQVERTLLDMTGRVEAARLQAAPA